MKGLKRGEKWTRQSQLRFEALKSSRKALVKTKTRFAFSVRSHGSSRRKSLQKNSKGSITSIASKSELHGQSTRNNLGNLSASKSRICCSSTKIQSNTENTARRKSSRQRKPSCRLSFGPFELASSRGTSFNKAVAPKTEILPIAEEEASVRLTSKTKTFESDLEEVSGRRTLRKRILTLEINEAPSQLTPFKITKSYNSSLGNTLGLKNLSSQKLRTVTIPEINIGLKSGLPISAREDSNQDCKIVQRNSPLQTCFEMSPSQYSMDADEFKTLFRRQTCYCFKDEGVFAKIEKSLKTNITLKLFCQGLDLIDGKRVGCTRTCPDARMYRVSQQGIFKLLCSCHRKRLKLHHCCPLCGHFCAKGGRIYVCKDVSLKGEAGEGYSEKLGLKTTETFHLFHKLCVVEEAFSILNWKSNHTPVDDNELDNAALDKIACPHCGTEGNFEEVSVEFQGSHPPVFFPDNPTFLTDIHVALVPKMMQIPSSKGNLLRLLDKSCSIRFNQAMEQAQNNVAEILSSSTLRSAMEKKDLDEFMALLIGKADPNQQFNDLCGQSLLHIAVQLGDICFIHALITSKADPNSFDNTRTTPLMVAGECDEPDIIKYLIAAGADKQLQNIDGLTTLHIIAKTGYLQAAQSLTVESDLQLLEIRDENGMTPLMVAAKFGHAGIVTYVLSLISAKDLHVNMVDKLGNTPMHWAAYGGSVDVVRILMKLLESANPQNEVGDSPLHVAVNSKNFECAIAILLNGGDLLLYNSNGKTPKDLCSLKTIEYEGQKIGNGLQFYQLEQIFHETISFRNWLEMKGQNSLLRRNYIISKDISNGREPNNRIRCVNFVDEEVLPSEFVYVSSSVITSSSIQPDLTYQSIHRCCSSKYKNTETSSRNCSTNICHCYANSQLCYLNERLNLPEGKLYFPNKSVLISECNQFCSCDVNYCENRVVQKGIKAHLEVFRTPREESSPETSCKGWGVKTRSNFTRGSFVCELIGEFISSLEASKRFDHSYMVELYRSANEEHSSILLVDSKMFGNVSRFLNHSCEPNLVLIKVFVEHSDQRFPRLAFFANREIPSGEELTFDYGDMFFSRNESLSEKRICRCGMKSCRFQQIQTISKDHNKS